MRKALGAVLAGCFMVSACGGPSPDKKPLPDPTETASSVATATTAAPTTVAEELEQPLVASTSPSTVDLDYGALDDHSNPERVLRYYADAVRKGAWEEAARAWSSDAEISSKELQVAFGGRSHVELVFGKGDSASAAGTLFYVAPVVVDFADKSDEDRRGTIVLRRANDVPGASAEQLDWRVERSDVMQPATQ